MSGLVEVVDTVIGAFLVASAFAVYPYFQRRDRRDPPGDTFLIARFFITIMFLCGCALLID
jgi:RsiW-degrading membrane proteinase PrsW (M82 family)